MPDKLVKRPRDPSAKRLIDIAIGKLNAREPKPGKEPGQPKAGVQKSRGTAKPK
jgi:hypothetical protein